MGVPFMLILWQNLSQWFPNDNVIQEYEHGENR